MSFVLARELISGEIEVKKLIDLASQAGYDVIELVWSKTRGSNTKVTGFQIPVIEETLVSIENREVDLSTDVKLIIGTVKFNVDKTSRCWAYIIDTPYNRKKIAQSIKTGWYKVVNNKIREEIREIALKEGYPTEPMIKRNFKMKVSPKEQELNVKIEDMQKQLKEMERREELIKKELEIAKGERKPLEGVKITKNQG